MYVAESPRQYKTFGKQRSLRLPGFDYRQSKIYHLTWGTHRRRRILTAPLADALVARLKEDAACAGIAVFAYCFMPDHAHLLVRPEVNSDVVRFVQRFKSKTTRTYWNAGGIGRLWQRGFYDHILRKEEDVEQVARYILANPVRAGLADDVTQYPYCGSLVNPL